MISATVLHLVYPALSVSAPAVVLLGRPTIVRRSHVLPVSLTTRCSTFQSARSGAPANTGLYQGLGPG